MVRRGLASVPKRDFSIAFHRHGSRQQVSSLADFEHKHQPAGNSLLNEQTMESKVAGCYGRSRVSSSFALVLPSEAMALAVPRTRPRKSQPSFRTV